MNIPVIRRILEKHGYEITIATDSASVSGQKSTATRSESIVVDAGGGMLWTRTERRAAQSHQSHVNGRAYMMIVQEQRDISVRQQVGTPAQPLTFLSPATKAAPLPSIEVALDTFLSDMATLPGALELKAPS